MKRILILGIALLAGAVVMALITKILREKGASHPLFQYRVIVSAAVGLVCFIGLSLMLELGAGSPQSRYSPAQFKDGQIVKGEFNEDAENTSGVTE